MCVDTDDRDRCVVVRDLRTRPELELMILDVPHVVVMCTSKTMH